jgi:hypothetical protein
MNKHFRVEMAGFALDEQNSDCRVPSAGLAFFSRCNWFSCRLVFAPATRRA